MWNKIITGVVIATFLFCFFLFYQNFVSLTGPSGEVAASITEFKKLEEHQLNISRDEHLKVYAEMRNEHFKQLKEQYNAEKLSTISEREGVEEDIVQTQAKYEQSEREYNELQEELKSLLSELAAAVGTSVSGTGSADTAVIIETVKQLMTQIDELTAKVAMEHALIASLGVENTRLHDLITKARKLNADRNARLSPEELSCRVVSCDPNWDFVILDAGINKGVVIGSRLAVMRGDQKICELTAKIVEKNNSSCEIVYSTLLAGEKVRPGDRVISVRNSNSN